MKIFKYIPKKVAFFFTGVLILNLLSSCGMGKIWDPADARKVPAGVDERVQKNLEEGKGFSIMKELDKERGGTTYQFASSNPMWRATLDILDFLPLANVDYSGGIITTDWYNEGTASDESIKITIRFLTNEIRADGLKVSLHQRICGTNNSCAISEVKTSLNEEIKLKILRKASLLKKQKDDEFEKKIYKKKKSSDKVKWCGDGRVVC